MTDEHIICAAIWYKELPLVRPEILQGRGFRPLNVDKGIVLFGLRHLHCIAQLVALTGKRQAEVGEYVQGFLTNTNRFVDRKEGRTIALEAGQLAGRDVSSRTELYSEDLY